MSKYANVIIFKEFYPKTKDVSYYLNPQMHNRICFSWVHHCVSCLWRFYVPSYGTTCLLSRTVRYGFSPILYAMASSKYNFVIRPRRSANKLLIHGHLILGMKSSLRKFCGCYIYLVNTDGADSSTRNDQRHYGLRLLPNMATSSPHVYIGMFIKKVTLYCMFWRAGFIIFRKEIGHESSPQAIRLNSEYMCTRCSNCSI